MRKFKPWDNIRMSSSPFSLLKFLSRSQEYLELEKGDDESSAQAYSDPSLRPSKTFRRRYLISLSVNIVLSLAFIFSWIYSLSNRNGTNDKELIRATSSVCKLYTLYPYLDILT